jgi:hypothetical protein
MDGEKVYGHFEQYSATAHNASYSIQVLHEVFDDRVVSLGLWPPRSPDINPCDFFVGILKG